MLVRGLAFCPNAMLLVRTVQCVLKIIRKRAKKPLMQYLGLELRGTFCFSDSALFLCSTATCAFEKRRPFL